jgi:hypothetical protein
MKARLSLIASAALLASCGDYSAPDSVVNGVAVITLHSATATWADYSTYSIDETVTVVDATGTIQQTCTVPGAQIAAVIRDQMTSRNYAELPWGQTTDLQFKLTAFLGSQDVYYADWCSWYGYYYCYPGWTYAGSYKFGTLVIDMGDVLHSTPPPVGGSVGELPLTWTAAQYGILSSYYAGCSGNGSGINWAKITEAVNRAFDQSPYIQRAPQMN